MPSPRALPALALVTLLAAGAVVAFAWNRRVAPTAAGTAEPTAAAPAAAPAATRDTAGTRSGTGAAPVPGAAAATPPGTRATGATAATTAGTAPPWPIGRSTTIASGHRERPAGEAAVPVRVAFRALWYLGVDPAAEATWRRAIDDPSLADGVRSDLIIDMIDEGYTDNERPTAADLPIVRARLEILERHAPYAIDEVNARAFERAYRDLLALYLRLGGEPRQAR